MAAVSPAPFTPTMLSLPDSVWRGDQLGSYRSTPVATGYHELDKELPGGGWPPSALVELLLPHPGIGELRLFITNHYNAVFFSTLSTIGPDGTIEPSPMG